MTFMKKLLRQFKVALLWINWRYRLWQDFPDKTVAWYGMYGRYDDPEPCRCFDCGWIGRGRDCYHGYEDDGEGESIAVDECPVCYSDKVFTFVHLLGGRASLKSFLKFAALV